MIELLLGGEMPIILIWKKYNFLTDYIVGAEKIPIPTCPSANLKQSSCQHSSPGFYYSPAPLSSSIFRKLVIIIVIKCDSSAEFPLENATVVVTAVPFIESFHGTS